MSSRSKIRNFSIVMSVLLLTAEILIGMFATGWLRIYFGDVLVIILLYFLIRIFTDKLPKALPFALFIFACIVELMQYIGICDILGIPRDSLAAIIIGTSGTWKDIPYYAAGMLILYVYLPLERRMKNGRNE